MLFKRAMSMVPPFLSASSRTLSGAINGAAATYMASRAMTRGGEPFLYITPHEGRALEAMDELTLFLGKGGEALSVDTVPWVEGSVYNEVLPDRYSIELRMAALARLHHGGHGQVLVISIESLLRRVIPPQVFDTFSLMVGADTVYPPAELARDLVRAGYQQVETVEERASFASRGQVLDLFVPASPLPVRVLFFDDIVEELWLFDPGSQKRIRQIDEITVHPARETILSSEDQLRERLYAMADKCAYPSTKSRYLLERIQSSEEFFGMETYTPLYHAALTSLSEYLPKGVTVIMEDPDQLFQSAAALMANEAEKYEMLKAEGRLLFPPDSFYIPAKELGAWVASQPQLILEPASSTPDVPDIQEFKDLTPLALELRRARAENLEPLLPLKSAIADHLAAGARVALVVPEEPDDSPLVRILIESGHHVNALTEESGILPDMKPGQIYAIRGYTPAGFYTHTDRLLLLSEEELFGRKLRRTRKERGFTPDIDSLDTLTEGDLVVHKDHGIGRYGGIHLMRPMGNPGEYLLIEYLGGDKLYLPAHKIALLARYRGGNQDTVKLDKLGGTGWEKRKQKVSEKVHGLADQLLTLATEKKSRRGVAYPSTDPMILDFEAAFPFEETEDQRKAIDAVMEDMGAESPMDRLICGDVGYGKTEVALRAAFLAVLGGKQVALLAPTTLLVEQHFRTFRERLAGFPVEVGVLSRFQPPKALKSTKAKLAKGEVDIVIGTHRILSRDIHFKDLGLLIVDEEQRFGVAQKEKLRFFKPTIEVLTLSATPIPRTLHMSILGIRDISLITTAPQDRLAVKSIVSPIKDQPIREAITRELARGGQVFVVVPRITGTRGSTKTIDEWYEYINDLVPEAKAAVAHGQMDPKELERVMIEYLSGERKLLISTNIIEAGLDISRANTILVMDAQNFGLSQLYQLRGRVGRSRVRAFAYFFVKDFGKLTPHAQKRLQAIQRYSHLGAGFNLASEDLEIRGAGEMLGKKQSGAIASVGFETYVEIVEEALRDMRGEPPPPEFDPELKSDLTGYLPEDFIPEPSERLRYYRRLATARDVTQVTDVGTLISDKYGHLPDEAAMLVELMKIKAMLRVLNAEGITLGARRFTIFAGNASRIDPAKLLGVMGQESRFTFDGPQAVTCKLPASTDPKERVATVQTHLRTLLNCVN